MSGSGIPANENWLIVVRFFAWWKSVNSCQLDLVEEATFICCWWAHMFHIFWFNLALTCDGLANYLLPQRWNCSCSRKMAVSSWKMP
jgi:hypothetical protein